MARAGNRPRFLLESLRTESKTIFFAPLDDSPNPLREILDRQIAKKLT